MLEETQNPAEITMGYLKIGESVSCNSLSVCEIIAVDEVGTYDFSFFKQYPNINNLQIYVESMTQPLDFTKWSDELNVLNISVFNNIPYQEDATCLLTGLDRIFQLTINSNVQIPEFTESIIQVKQLVISYDEFDLKPLEKYIPYINYIRLSFNLYKTSQVKLYNEVKLMGFH